MIDDLKAILETIQGLLDRRDDARRRETPAVHVQASVDRFKYLVVAHGLKLAQIPGLVPSSLPIRLSQLKNDESIAEILTPDFLNWVSDFFGIQRTWLEGGSDQVYAPVRSAYKHAGKFVAWLQQAGWWTEELEMIVFTPERSLREERAAGPMAITMARPLPAFPDSDCRQFLPTVDLWEWGHRPCRASVLELAARVCDHSGIPIRVYRVSHKTVEQIQRRELVPNPFALPRCKQHRESLDTAFDLASLEIIDESGSNIMATPSAGSHSTQRQEHAIAPPSDLQSDGIDG